MKQYEFALLLGQPHNPFPSFDEASEITVAVPTSFACYSELLSCRILQWLAQQSPKHHSFCAMVLTVLRHIARKSSAGVVTYDALVMCLWDEWPTQAETQFLDDALALLHRVWLRHVEQRPNGDDVECWGQLIVAGGSKIQLHLLLADGGAA